MADFKDYKHTTFSDIKDYVDKEHPEYLPTLIEQVDNDVRYMDIKIAFYNKFFPEFKPKAKPKKATMRELLGLSKK